MATNNRVGAVATTAMPSEQEIKPDSSNFARRSISIFSRRGMELPEGRPPFVAQVANPAATVLPLDAASAATPVNNPKSDSTNVSPVIRPPTQRHRSWMSRSKSFSISPTSPKSPQKPIGTILNAVPPAKLITMSALEEEMATSPNEEILSAIGENTSRKQRSNSLSLPASPVLLDSPTLPSPRLPLHILSLATRTNSQKKRDAQSRIGVWVDGIVRWDEDPRRQSFLLDAKIEAQTGLTPLRPSLRRKPQEDPTRPLLSVNIPEGANLDAGQAVPAVCLSQPPHPVIPIVPDSIAPKFIGSLPPSITVMAVTDLPPFADSAPNSGSTTGRRDSGMIDDAMPPPRDAPSASTCSSPVDRAASACSKRSSATSVEGGMAAAAPSMKRASVDSQRRSSLMATSRFSASPADGQTHRPRSRPNSGNLDVDKPLPAGPALLESPPLETPVDQATQFSFLKNADDVLQSSSVAPKKSTRRSRNAQSMRMPPNHERRKSSSAREMRKSLSMRTLEQCDREFMLSAPETPEVPAISPTLSQAENDLHVQLTRLASTVAADKKKLHTSSRRTSADVKIAEKLTSSRPPSICGSVRSVLIPPQRAPTIPKRSRKRELSGMYSGDEVPTAKTAEGLTVPESATGVSRRKSASEVRSEERAADAQDFRRCATVAHVKKNQSFKKNDEQVEKAETPADGESVSTPNTRVNQDPEAQAPIPVIQVDEGLIVVEGPRKVRKGEEVLDPMTVKAVSAEEVLIRIMSTLHSHADLFNMAIINKGMYRVFKDNEMALVRKVAFNASPAACEFREWSPPGSDRPLSCQSSIQVPEYTPHSWLRDHRRDQAVIDSLKGLILERCSTSIRRDTALAMSFPQHAQAQQINDAFWRIWCFCKIFGYEKGREDDITGQLDWLKGGILANNQGCAATVNTNLEFDMSSVLLNAPDHFAMGNADGLSAAQLFDMTEIWTCMNSLLSGYLSRIEQAKDYGVFSDVEVSNPKKIKDEQEAALEEWTFHLLTLGPTVVLEMAEFASEEGPAGFALARERGWTKWSLPLYNGSRSSFLKEPVARLYEEREMIAKRRDPREVERKEISRKRVAHLAKEIKLRRQTSAYKRAPFIDMANERPMSMFSRRGSGRSQRADSFRTACSRRNSMIREDEEANQLAQALQSRLQDSKPACSPSNLSPQHSLLLSPLSGSFSPTSTPISPAASTATHPLLHQNSVPGFQAPRKISPIIEDRVETFNGLAQLYPHLAPQLEAPPKYTSADDVGADLRKTAPVMHLAESSSDRAIATIVALGYTEAQAKDALRKTDAGSGLRLDRAIELLNRQNR